MNDSLDFLCRSRSSGSHSREVHLSGSIGLPDSGVGGGEEGDNVEVFAIE